MCLDPLELAESKATVFDSLAAVGRIMYFEVTAMLHKTFEHLAEYYGAMPRHSESGNQNRTQAKIVWIMLVMSAFVGTGTSSSLSDSDGEQMDGEFISCVFLLARAHQARFEVVCHCRECPLLYTSVCRVFD